jgi:hypothetical protein
MTRPRPFVDHALSARLEAAAAAQIEDLARVVAERLPERGAAVLEVAGGRASFVAPDISISRAVGLGMRGPVSTADVDALEHFYRSRLSQARILVSPFAHASLFAQLGERGFRLVWLDSVLVRHLDGGERSAASDGIEVRLVRPGEAAAWLEASLIGLAPPGEAPCTIRAPIFSAAFDQPSVAYFFALIDGVIAGTAATYFHGGAARLFAGSTLPAHRGRGVQGALIQARLAHAARAGADLVFAEAEAGSTSQRNLERSGLAMVYSQALMIKRFD